MWIQIIQIIPLAVKFSPVSEPRQSKGVDPSAFVILHPDIKSGFLRLALFPFCFSFLKALLITLVPKANTSLYLYLDTHTHTHTHISLPFLFTQLVLSLFYYIEKKKNKSIKDESWPITLPFPLSQTIPSPSSQSPLLPPLFPYHHLFYLNSSFLHPTQATHSIITGNSFPLRKKHVILIILSLL